MGTEGDELSWGIFSYKTHKPNASPLPNPQQPKGTQFAAFSPWMMGSGPPGERCMEGGPLLRSQAGLLHLSPLQLSLPEEP